MNRLIIKKTRAKKNPYVFQVNGEVVERCSNIAEMITCIQRRYEPGKYDVVTYKDLPKSEREAVGGLFGLLLDNDELRR